MRDDMVALVIEVAKEILDAEGVPHGEMDHETKLFGEDGIFDSMGLVSLIVAVEQEVEDRFGKAVALADERALSRSSSPYRTVGTLADYAVETSGSA